MSVQRQGFYSIGYMGGGGGFGGGSVPQNKVLSGKEKLPV